jgi:hypothetical protein
MRRVKVIINYSNLSVLELIELARNSAIKMAANATVFVTPDVLYAAMNAAATLLETKYNAAQGGGKQQTAEMNQARKALEELIRKQALYVERIANGNESIILSSGFAISRQPVYNAQPDFEASNGEHSGEVLLKHKAVQGAKSWVWQYSTDGVEWTHSGISTQTSYLVTGLTPVSKYWFRSAYVTIDGQSEWSNPVSEVVK